ncbi:MAG TPA: hypothetical protein VJW20_05400 [Candidatus Angelobacter sp.]|nr:hypothetical protein [Candidatus Angelobacter sp.]
MAEMSNYCRAYRAEELRQFPGWRENTAPMKVHKDSPAETGPASTSAETGNSFYFFVHEDFTVTAGVFHDQDIAFNTVTKEWKTFCVDQLKFEPPRPSAAT